MSTITTVVPPFTKVPNINDSVNFESDVDTFLNEINARYVAGNSQVSEMNTVASEVNTNATTTQTNKNSVDTNKALTETYKNETLGYRNEVLGYTIPTEATYDTATIDSKINAIALYSGYMNWKEDNFYFNTSSSFLASIADTNRYVKFGDKVVDTYLHANYNATYGGVVKSATDLIPEVIVQDQTTYGLTTQSSVNAGDYVVVDRKELVTNGTFDTDTSWSYNNNGTIIQAPTGHISGGVATIYSTGTFQAFNQKIGSTANAKHIIIFDVKRVGSGALKVIVAPVESGSSGVELATNISTVGTHIVEVQSSYEWLIIGRATSCDIDIDNVRVIAKDEVYRAKVDAPSGTLLTNTTYFEVRDNLPISNQIAFLHTMDATTKAYEGITNEILFNDALAIETPKAIMLKNGFSEVSKGLYSKGSKLYVFAGYWQTLNKGAYHPVFNMAGTASYGNTVFGTSGRSKWYDSAVLPNNTVSLAFLNKTLDSSGRDDGSILGTADTIYPRPDGKFYDIIYQDQFKRCDTIAFRGYTELIKQIEESKYFKGIQSNKAFYDNAGTLTSTIVNYNSSGNHLEVEILGAKANYPTILTNRLNEGKRIFATLNQTDDTGASNLPNGSKTSFKMLNKMLQNYKVIKYASGTYTKLTLTTHYTVNLTTNTINFVTAPLSTDVFFIANKVQNNPLSLVNLVDYNIAWEDNFVFASNNYDVSKKVPLLVNNITNKISTGTSPIEQLAITKIVSDLVYTTAKTATVDASIRFILAVKDDEYYAGVRADIGDTNSIDLTDNIYLMPLGVSR